MKSHLRKISLLLTVLFVVSLVLTTTHTYAAAAIGHALLAPEDGWKRYDDSYVKGTMPVGSVSGYYQSTGTWTQTPGHNIKFKFYGSKIRLLTYTYTGDHATKVNVKIDGVDYTYSESYDSATLTLVFEKTGLETGFHDVVIESVQRGVWTSLDAIDVDQEGYIVGINAPAELKATPADAQAALTWTEVIDASEYTVYYGTKPGEYTGKLTASKDKIGNFIVSNLTNGTKYYFVVTATVNGVESGYSNEVSATPFRDEQPNPGTEQPNPGTEQPNPGTEQPNPGTGQPNPGTEEPTGSRAILVITMITGLEKEYDLPINDVNAFLKWYDTRDTGSGPAKFAINKYGNNKGPFSKRTDYVIFDKILTFEVNEY